MTRAPRGTNPRSCAALLALLSVAVCAGGGYPQEAEPDPVDPYSLLDSAPEIEPSREPEPIDILRAGEEELEEARVLLRTGREIIGLFISRDDRIVTLRVRGEDLRLDLADAVEFEKLGPVLESFRSLRAATPDEDTAGRLHLVRWLRDRGVYAAALDEAEAIVKQEPFNHEAAEIALWLREQIRLKLSALESRDRAEQAEPRPPQRPRQRIDDFPVLTPEEINLIRVYEIDFSDPPRIHLPRPVVEEFIELYADSGVVPRSPEGRKALLRRDPLTVLDLMFRAQARPLYGEVRVLDDPKSMELFRSQIHKTWLVGSNSSCASTSCHGGQEAGRLYLNNRRANSDATVYTNFLILDRFRLEDGTPLIDHQEPANSPLLQMALPRERSSRPHPDITRTESRRGWRPYFRDEDDLRFRRAVEWIRSLYNPRPNYPIEYTPPVPRSVERLEQLPPPGER